MRRIKKMGIALKIVLAVASVILIITILLQSSNSDGLSGSIGGGAEQLFGKRKSQGYDAIFKQDIGSHSSVVYRAFADSCSCRKVDGLRIYNYCL